MTGRNELCPCGSGKKYKKCCLAKDQAAAAERLKAEPPLSVPVARPEGSATYQEPAVVAPAALKPAGRVLEPPPPRDPVAVRADEVWQRFEDEEDEGRIAIFHETLEDAEVMDDTLAFEMLSLIRGDAVRSANRQAHAECVAALRARLPEVYLKSAHFYLCWCLLDALAEARYEAVPGLARELATCAGRDVDLVERGMSYLGYHERQEALVEVCRIAWPLVKSSENVVPWGVSEFANEGADYEIFNYLEQTEAPDPADPALLERIRFFVDEPNEDYVRELIGDLSGLSGREWKSDDFALKPMRRGRRGDWYDDDDDDDDGGEKSEAIDRGASNLHRLVNEFVGYLRREEAVWFPRGRLVRTELYDYFVKRSNGDLDPRPSMLEQAMNPKKKLPKPPRPIHPLCPERVTLDVHLAGLLDMMNALYHTAAALIQAMPAWLRFLESKRLIDAGMRGKVLEDLRPLHATLLNIWEQFEEDPALYRDGRVWATSP
jgi:hypothetical protein